jgi:HEAT repeat protein
MFVTKTKPVLALVLVAALALGGISTGSGDGKAPTSKDDPVGPDSTRKRLKDADPQERLKAALDLSRQLDEEAVNILIELLAVLPAAQRRQAELALKGIAEDWSPNPTLAREDEISRRILRASWAVWWRNTDGSAVLAAFQKQTLNPTQRAKALSRIRELADEKVCDAPACRFRDRGDGITGRAAPAPGFAWHLPRTVTPHRAMPWANH